MRSPEDIVKYIDKHLQIAIERPSMFASSPRSLEDTLYCLVTLLEYSLDIKPANHPNSYQMFLQSRGFGVGSFTRKYYPHEKLSDNDRRAFAEFATFFKEFLDGFREQVKAHIQAH